MTRSEARAELMVAARGRTVCITIQDWHHAKGAGRPYDRIVFRVSVLPGVNGEECSQWDGTDLRSVVADAVADMLCPTDPLTVAQADDYFTVPAKPDPEAVDLTTLPPPDQDATTELPAGSIKFPVGPEYAKDIPF